MSSNLDAGLVYRPPNTLQFPKGMEPTAAKASSRAESPDSSSSSQSDLSFSPTLRRDIPPIATLELDPALLAAKLEEDETIAVLVGVDPPETGVVVAANESPVFSTQSSVSGTSPGGRFSKTPVC